MAVASTRTQLPLDTFAAICGIHPLLFNGVTFGDEVVANNALAVPFVQYNWQNSDSSGREEIAQIIAEAEKRITEYLNFDFVPTWNLGERHEYPRPRNPELFSTWGFDVRGMWRTMRLNRAYIISGGVEAQALIEAQAAIVYSDVDSDGYKETATISVSTAGVASTIVFGTAIQPQEIALYYPGHDGDNEWEIRPTTVTLDNVAQTAVIVCRREQLVVESAWSGFGIGAVDGANDASFLTVVDVYRHYNDPSNQVMFQWMQIWAAGQSTIQNGSMMVFDPLTAVVTPQPGVWDVPNGMFNLAWWTQLRMPDWAFCNYLAGWPLKGGRIDPMWARAVTYFALAMLDRPLAGSNAIKEFTNYWADDRSQNDPGRTMLTTRRKLDNPLGTSRAAIYVWDMIQRLKAPEPVVDV